MNRFQTADCYDAAFAFQMEDKAEAVECFKGAEVSLEAFSRTCLVHNWLTQKQLSEFEELCE